MKKVKKGDQVQVLTGKDKGRRGNIIRVMPDGDKVLVENVNMVKRHTKPNPAMGAPGGIVEREAPLQISNVALVNPATDKPDRVGFKLLDDGRKVRVFKSNGEVLDA
jgi:large subunit ribosomal protein L24